MLDLQAGVHLDEVELAVLVEELHGAGAAIAELAHGRGRQLADPAALLGVEGRRGALLPAPSGGGAAASSRARPDARRCRGRRPAPGSRCGAAAADISRGRPSRCRRRPWPRRGRARSLGRAVGVVDDLHAAPAAAGHRLDQHRPADLGCRARRPPRPSRPGPGEPGHQRQAELLGGLLGHDLVAHHADVLGRRADEGEAVRLDASRRSGRSRTGSRSRDGWRRRR